ncbi:LacI family DNA-binding transcriptional regulator [Uliginosibacterium sp. sgz301328]|uniref:LacI family DNA-binding transcriptional regulator n=1 Tax=Uliginosibacterium sp. sgz301328 TaxID=3243764 RepID=UPI00359DD008
MPGKLRIRQLAEQTGLSISTVSRVLAGKGNVSARAKEKVLACARTQGVLHDLSSGRLLFRTVTIFAPPRAFDVRMDIFYFKVIEGVREAVSPYDTRVTYSPLEERDCDVALFLKKIADPSVEAAILIGIDDPLVHEMAADMGKPCVLVNCRDTTLRLDAVLPDHQLIGQFGADWLIQQGHHDILVVQCLRRATMERRLAGIRDAFAAANVPFVDEHNLVTTGGFGAEEARQAVLGHFAHLPRNRYPTAILAGGDFMAAGAMKAVRELNLSVPRDISVMSMDGFNLAQIDDVALTSMHVPRSELGFEAIRILQQRLTRPEAPFGTLLLNGRLIVRDSVRRLGRRTEQARGAQQDYSLYGN